MVGAVEAVAAVRGADRSEVARHSGRIEVWEVAVAAAAVAAVAHTVDAAAPLVVAAEAAVLAAPIEVLVTAEARVTDAEPGTGAERVIGAAAAEEYVAVVEAPVPDFE